MRSGGEGLTGLPVWADRSREGVLGVAKKKGKMCFSELEVQSLGRTAALQWYLQMLQQTGPDARSQGFAAPKGQCLAGSLCGFAGRRER